MEESDVESCAGELLVWPDTASEDEYYMDHRHCALPAPQTRQMSVESSPVSTRIGMWKSFLQELHQPEVVASESATTCAETDSVQSEVPQEQTAEEEEFAALTCPGLAPPKDKTQASHQPNRCRVRRGAARGSIAVPKQIFDGLVTTLMVRNVPEVVCQVDFMAELDRSGFHGKYDFCYVPVQNFMSRKHLGYAFVNFVSTEAARYFACQWQGTHRFGKPKNTRALDVSPASVQGREANIRRASGARICHIKNSKYRPFVATVSKDSRPAPDQGVQENEQRMVKPAESAQTVSLTTEDVPPQASQPRRPRTRRAAVELHERASRESTAAGRGGDTTKGHRPGKATHGATSVTATDTAARPEQVHPGSTTAHRTPNGAADRCVVSLGSWGHPVCCNKPCKFFSKPRGCKDGALCDHCHLCAVRAT